MKKSKCESFLLYFIMIPFLHPRGFDECFGLYSKMFKGWQYFNVVLIVAQIIIYCFKKRKLTLNLYSISIATYFGVMFFETLLIRHTFNECIQKIFLVPFLVLYTIMEMKSNPRSFVKTVNNILFVNFVLNMTAFSPLIWKDYFNPVSNHLSFLGHVQVNAQIGMLSFLFLCIEYFIYSLNKKKFLVRIVITIVTMFSAFTSASYIAIVFICLFFYFDSIKKRKQFIYPGKYYVTLFVLLNLFFMYYVSFVNINISFGPISMSGRGYIWIEAMNKIKKSPLIGYGVHGVMVKTFWNKWAGNQNGMNYMHNQLLQVLCDGGALLVVPFILMLISSIKSVDKIHNIRLRFGVIVCAIVMLLIMTFESSLEYVYGHMIFASFVIISSISSDIKAENIGQYLAKAFKCRDIGNFEKLKFE